MHPSFIHTRINAGTFWITLARPEKRNALTQAMIQDLDAAFETASRAPEVQSIVLDAEGPDFCAGLDLDELQASISRSLESREEDALALARLYLRIRSIPRATIARVQGRALGGGCGLASACAWVIAEEDATFGYPEIQIGFVPAIVAPLLRRLVGEKRAADLLMSGRAIGAKEAERIGLITRAIPTPDLGWHLDSLLKTLALRSPLALQRTHQALFQGTHSSLAEEIFDAARLNAQARTDPALHTALMARRKPTS